MNGYISKESNLFELSACISRVLTGETYLAPAYMSVLFHYLLRHHQLFKKKDLLTTRQLEVANYLALGHSTSTIGRKIGLHISTISKFKSIIFSKLGVDSVLALKDILEADGQE